MEGVESSTVGGLLSVSAGHHPEHFAFEQGVVVECFGVCFAEVAWELQSAPGRASGTPTRSEELHFLRAQHTFVTKGCGGSSLEEWGATFLVA